MSDFVQIYRDLLKDPSIVSLPPSYRCVLTTLLAYACYAPCKVDDHGIAIELQPGQFMCSIRHLAELANVGRKDAEHAISKFITLKILGQKVGHKKSIFTILWGIKFNDNGTTSGTKVGQEWDIKEEDKEYKYIKPPPLQTSHVKKGEGEGDLKKAIQLAKLCKERNLPFTERKVTSLYRQYPHASFDIIVEFAKRKPSEMNLKYPDKWLDKHVKEQHEYLEHKKEYE